ncbi:MAG: glutamate synthase small chain [Solirubrobacteraceae bacterium]|nr:glutamate synthase small chain [Solirubrobacteraceae bacterium]
MGDPSGFLDIHRVPMPERDPRERVRDHNEIFGVLPDQQLKDQGARCMDCGVPFCHDGCPLGNLIPDWNDLVYHGRWREAIDQLHATNNFPEFTGLICPAPCESACVLAIEGLDNAVMIKQIEYAIVHRAWEEGWIRPIVPEQRSGRRVAVVGSGPAGLAVAQQLNHAGHAVVVFERDEGPGGLLRFGVPDAKLEKWMIDRRVDVLAAEEIEFRYGVDVGRDLPVDRLKADFDAVIVATGSRVARDAGVAGEDLDGVRYAMDYLYQRNRWVARQEGRPSRDVAPEEVICAAGKHVAVIGGGDTGMDCLSSANREGAASVVMYDVYPELPETGRYADAPWPDHPRRTATTYALDEGGERRFGHQILRIVGRDGRVVAVEGREVTGTSSRDLAAVIGSEFTNPADLVLVAIGFTHPEHEGLVAGLGVELDARGNVKAGASFATSVDGVFACGDARRGQSLVVTAIAEGRRCARAVDRWLAGAPAAAGAAA